MNQFLKKNVEAEVTKITLNEEVRLDDKKEESKSYDMKVDAPNSSDKDIEECFDFNFKDELKMILFMTGERCETCIEERW